MLAWSLTRPSIFLSDASAVTALVSPQMLGECQGFAVLFWLLSENRCAHNAPHLPEHARVLSVGHLPLVARKLHRVI